MRKESDFSTPARTRPVSAGIGGLYALCLHAAVWLGYAIAYLAVPENGNHLLKILAPLCIMIAGLAVFVMLCVMISKSRIFYGAVLISHILLCLVFWGVGGYLTPFLQSIKGEAPPVNSPDGDLSGLYAVVDWFLLALGTGGMLFLLSVIFALRDTLLRSEQEI